MSKDTVLFAGFDEKAKEKARTVVDIFKQFVWQAYEHLEKSKVRGAGPQKLLTNIISLIRFAVGESDILEPFSETVDRRFSR